jgi:hypothetical protein
MYKVLLFCTVALSACDDPEAMKQLSTGKVALDPSIQVDLKNVINDDLYDDKIILRRKVSREQLKNTKFDLEVIQRIDSQEIEVVHPPPGVDVLEFIEEMRASGLYEFVEPNITRHINPPQIDGVDMETQSPE